MNETTNDKNLKTESSDNQDDKKEPAKKTQGQLLQEALGLEPKDIQEIEKKLFISRFLDYFSEETLDFIYKDSSIEQYKSEISNYLELLRTTGNEEDKLIIKGFKDKQIMDIVYQLKKKAEELAYEKAKIKQPVDKRLRKLSLMTTLPMFGVLILFTFLFIDMFFLLIPILCVFCMAPQILRGRVLKKWQTFKEENRTQFYTDNRTDIIVLKEYTGEILDNIRTRLLDMKIPLQLIKFVLHSRDYENLKLLNQKSVRGVTQFFFSFDYPDGMEPFPIPDALLQQMTPESEGPKKIEKNFVVLTKIVGKDGVLTQYLPSLRINLAEQINKMLNICEFTEAPQKISTILPNLKEMPILCVCGKDADFSTIQICNWKNQFKFYLFEGKECNCGKSVYVLSLMDDKAEIPEEIKDIFSN